MSRARISAGVAARPTLYRVWACADAAMEATRKEIAAVICTNRDVSGALHMAHLSVPVYIPRLDAVVVIGTVQSADGHELIASGLHVSSVVGASRLQ